MPAAFAPALARAAQRWNVSATLLAAQLYAESNFNPFAVSRAGAQGIAQFMPGTAAAMGLRDPFDAERAIDAQARLMRDLLRRFPAVPLALAAYNAGPGAVAACGCVPANGETPGYVARILGLMTGAGATHVSLARGPAGAVSRRAMQVSNIERRGVGSYPPTRPLPRKAITMLSKKLVATLGVLTATALAPATVAHAAPTPAPGARARPQPRHAGRQRGHPLAAGRRHHRDPDRRSVSSPARRAAARAAGQDAE